MSVNVFHKYIKPWRVENFFATFTWSQKIILFLMNNLYVVFISKWNEWSFALAMRQMIIIIIVTKVCANLWRVFRWQQQQQVAVAVATAGAAAVTMIHIYISTMVFCKTKKQSDKFLPVDCHSTHYRAYIVSQHNAYAWANRRKYNESTPDNFWWLYIHAAHTMRFYFSLSCLVFFAWTAFCITQYSILYRHILIF